MAQKKKIFSSSSSFIHRNCLNFSLVRVYLLFFFKFVVHFWLNTAASKNEQDFKKMMLTFFDAIR
jgi:hypothetical protein